jgi:glycerol-3-phosphate acyltransferase PlsY
LGLLAVVIGYLLGAIPTAYIVVKLRKGEDIRKLDVGNVGAGSTFRTCGIGAGTVVAIVDVGKGAGSILIAHYALGVSEPWVLGAGLAAVIGHTYPVFIGFKGGQGAATIIGIFFVLAPKAMGVLLIPMAIILIINRKVFFGRLFFTIFVVAPFLPLVIWLFGGSLMLTLYSLAIILFVILKNLHRRREMKGELTSETTARKIPGKS